MLSTSDNAQSNFEHSGLKVKDIAIALIPEIHYRLCV